MSPWWDGGSDTKKREALEVEVYSPFLQLKLISPGPACPYGSLL